MSVATASLPLQADFVEPAWVRARTGRYARAVAQRLTLFPVARVLCHPLTSDGAPAKGPLVFAANHSSHADTAAVLAALPRRMRARTASAAAEDYFFRSRARGFLVRLFIGAFPFPRHGCEGLARASGLVARGWSVLIFPEGTRSTDGSIASFRKGVGVLASAGATIVPVGIAGTRDVLPKNCGLPRRAPVSVHFGEAVDLAGVDPCEAAATIEQAVRRCVTIAMASRPASRPTWYARVRRFAVSPRALVLLFAWGVAEALAFPIIPDLGVGLLAAAAPEMFIPLAASALAGSITGGAVAYGIGSRWGPTIVAHLPLVSPRMVHAAQGWLLDQGPRGLQHQAWSGVPYKTFAYQAAHARIGLGAFAWQTFIVRGARFLEVGMVLALVGRLGRRVAPALYGFFSIVVLTFFVTGLIRVVIAWS